MKNALWKTAYREILRSPGRFLAILGIITLGSGFFAGLRVSRDAMVKTASTYLSEYGFYDFAVSSTLGYTEDTVDALIASEYVADAEGSIKADAIVSGIGDEEHVMSFISLAERINAPKLTEGRLPAAPDECIIDASRRDVMIGGTVTLSDLNDADTLDRFASRQFTVVGYASSPLYLNYERGSTSLGSGSVTGFIYVPRESFSADYFTTIYITCPDMPYIYSAAYEKRSEELEPVITALADECAAARYNEIVDAATEELNKGEAEYEEGLQQYEAEKSDATQKLDDALTELRNAEQQLIDGRNELVSGREEMAKRRTEAERAIKNAERQLEDAKAQLDDGEAQYSEGLAQYEAGKAQYEAGVRAYSDAAEAVANAQGVYDEMQRRYDEEHSESAGGGEAEESPAGDEESDNSILSGIFAAIRERLGENGENSLLITLYGDEILTWANSALEPYGIHYDTVDELLAASRAYREQVQEQREQAREERRETITAAALENAKASLEAAQARLNAMEPQLAEAKSKLDEGKATLDASRAELDAGWAEYNSGQSDLARAKRTLASSMAEAEQQLTDAEQELTDGEARYAEGVQEYLDSKETAEEGFREAEAQLKDAADELQKARDAINDIPAPAVFSLGRWANIGYACFDSDSTIVKSISKVFPIFFFLVAALICMTTVTRMVDEQRGQLGVLMALGYSRLAVMSKYLIYAGSATVLGCAVGILGGSYLIPQVLWKAYSIMYSFSDRLEFYLDVPMSLAIFFAYLAAMMAVTYLSLRSEMNETPANIIRPKPPKSGKRVLIERVGFLWNRLSFMWKVTMRNIFRYKERVLMMVLGIGGCTALMITGFGIRDSIQNIVEYQYTDITLYDYDVLFSEPLSRSEQERFSRAAAGYAGDTLFLHQASVNARAGKTEKAAYLTVVPESEKIGSFVSFHDGKTALDYPEDGCALINSGLAEVLHLSVGDTVTLSTDAGDFDLTVSGVFENYIYNYVYITEETYLDLFGTAPEIKCAYIAAGGDGGDSETAARLLSESGVISVTAGSVLQTRISGIMDNLIYIVILTIVCAAALAFIVIYNLTNINIQERMREIATVKVLGFYPGETATYVLRENILLTALGALLGIPLGIALNAYVISAIKVDLVSFKARVAPTSFLIAVALTIVFSLLVDAVMARKLSRIDMASALKAAE